MSTPSSCAAASRRTWSPIRRPRTIRSPATSRRASRSPPPLSCEGKGPFRWAALSGDPDDIRVTDEAVLAEIPDDPMLHRWMKLAREKIAFQGLPARICWLGYGQRHRVGLRFNELVRTGAV